MRENARNFPVFLDICRRSGIMKPAAKQISLRGVGNARLRVERQVQTREPDTVNTVVGKDAHMDTFVSHCTGTGLQCGIFYLEVSL